MLYLVASHVGLGNLETARSAAVGAYVRTDLFRPSLMDALAEGLRAAQVPE